MNINETSTRNCQKLPETVGNSQVLRLEPGNEAARRELEKLEARELSEKP